MAVEVLLGLGSNQQPETNLAAGIARLDSDFSLRQVSPWYQSPAMGFSGSDFINLVVLIEIDSDDEASIEKLVAALKQIEYDFGRRPDAVKYSSRALDIDLLMVGDVCGEIAEQQLPRSDIWQFAFVLRPLLDIRPELMCPKRQHAIKNYWPAVSNQPLTKLPDRSGET